LFFDNLNLFLICYKLGKMVDVFVTGRNEVRWRPGQEASWAPPHVRTWGLSEANALCWKSTCDLVGTFPRPSLDTPLVFVSVLHSPGVCFFRSIHVITAVQAVSYEWPPTLFRERHSGDPLRKKLNYHSFQGSSPTRWSCDTSPWPWTAPTPWIWASSVTCSTLRGFLLLAKMNLRLTRVQG